MKEQRDHVWAIVRMAAEAISGADWKTLDADFYQRSGHVPRAQNTILLGDGIPATSVQVAMARMRRHLAFALHSDIVFKAEIATYVEEVR